jgi:hypothetical protein
MESKQLRTFGMQEVLPSYIIQMQKGKVVVVERLVPNSSEPEVAGLETSRLIHGLPFTPHL